MWNQDLDVAASVTLIHVPLLPKKLKNGHHSCEPRLKKSDDRGMLLLFSLKLFLNRKLVEIAHIAAMLSSRGRQKGRKGVSTSLLLCSLSVCASLAL